MPIQTLRSPAQFRFMLAQPPVARSSHFFLYCWPPRQSATAVQMARFEALFVPVQVFHLGVILPKRFARRAVTRNLMRRQVYALARQLLAGHEKGAWLLRMRSGLDVHSFPSASSKALKQAMRAELLALMAKALP